MLKEAKLNGGINLRNWNIRRAQIIVTYSCNKNCPFCINYELGKKRSGFIKISDVVYFLNYLKYIGKLEEAIIVFLGGEPTLLPIDSLKEIATIAHELGYKTEFYTNGTLKEKLLELDGYIDFITISNYTENILPFEDNVFLYKFEKSTITISKLITKQDFKTFEEFDEFVDQANKLPFNYDFSTMQETTPNFNSFAPAWVEEELIPLCESQDVRGNVGASLYKGRLIKLPHKHLKRVEDICTLKLYPNGNLNTTWRHDQMEINYKEELKKLLESNSSLKSENKTTQKN